MTRQEKTLTAALALLGLFFLALATLFHSTLFHQSLLKGASRITGWEFKIQKSSIRLRTCSFHLEGVEIRKGEDFTLNASSLHLHVSPLSVIQGKLITQIKVEQPTLTLSTLPKKKEGSSLPLVHLFDQLEKSLWLQNIILDRIVLRQPTVRLVSGETFRGDEVSLSITPTLLKHIDLNVAATSLQRNEKNFLSHLFLSVTLKRNGVHLHKMKLAAEKVQLALEGKWEGDLEKGATTLQGEFAAPTVLREPITFQLASTFKNRRALISSLKAGLGEGSFEGSGFFDEASGTYSLPFTVKNLDLDSIFGQMKSKVLFHSKGEAKVEGKIEGKLPQWVIRSEATIENFRHRSLGATKLAGEVNLNWPLLTFDAGFYHGERRTGDGKGGVAFKHIPGREKLQALPQTIDLHFDKTPLEELLPNAKITGNLEGGLKLEGVLTSVKGEGTMTVTDGTLGRLKVQSLTTEVGILPGGEERSSEATFSKSTIALTDLSPFSWPGTLHLKTSGDILPFTGQLSPSFSIQGSYTTPTDTFKIERASFTDNENQLTFQGTIAPGEKVDMKGVGNTNLSWLKFWNPAFRESSGAAKIDLRLSGSLRDPSLQGRAEFLGNALSFRGFPEEFTGLAGSLRFQGKEITSDIKGNLDDGKFHLEGKSSWGEGTLQTVDLKLQGERLSLPKPGAFHADFDCDLTLKGKFPAPKLSGNINIIGGRYFKKFEIRNLLIRAVEEGKEGESFASWGNTQFALRVKSPGSLEIKNNIATIFLAADLSIDGTLRQPHMEGAMTLEEGTFHYLGTDFTLTEGRIEFNHPTRIDPTLFFVGEEGIPKGATIPTHVVRVQMEGRLSNLHFAYSSAPSEAKEDILSLIAFGMTREELKASGRSRQSLTTGLLAEEISGILERPLTRATGLDIFRLEAGSSTSSSPVSLSRLAIGKNVTNRWTVEFKTDLDPAVAERTFQTNYYLTDNLLFKGSRTLTTGKQKYNFGLSLRFRLN